MDQLFLPLDLYCERTDASLWSEPVNALTNLLIVAAGLSGLRQVRSHGTGMYAEILCWWVVAIGLGSLIFHMTAVELTKWADIVPIGTFTLALALFCLRRFARLGWPRAIAYFLIFFTAISFITWLVPQWLHEATNGTTVYLPAFAEFLFFGIVALARGSLAGWHAIACAGILLVAFVFRAIDQAVCAAFPLGTHFMWHSLIAAMLWVMLQGVARYGAPSRPRGG